MLSMTQLQVAPETRVRPAGELGVIPAACQGALAAMARLTRELETLEAMLRDAEWTANSPATSVHTSASSERLDVGSRLAELERRELMLQERERTVEKNRSLVLRSQEKLRGGKESLKRAIARFRSEVDRQVTELDARSNQLAHDWSELLEARRMLARQESQLKLVARAVTGSGARRSSRKRHEVARVGER